MNSDFQAQFARRAFPHYDKNGDNFITNVEIISILEAIGKTVNSSEILALNTAVDTDGDGRVDMGEFIEGEIHVRCLHRVEVVGTPKADKEDRLHAFYRQKDVHK